jgi:RNA polymerase sigma-70 factor, ECF subfamily
MSREDDEPVGRWVERLYDRHAAGLYRYAVMILADPDSAADAVHQVFAALVRRKSVDVAFELPYLKRAVRNECFSMLRREQRSPVDASVAILESVQGVEDKPDERLELERALKVLPPEQREVVHLKIFEGLTFQEMAELTGDSINTVASRYRYAIEKLRALLDGSNL